MPALRQIPDIEGEALIAFTLTLIEECSYCRNESPTQTLAGWFQAFCFRFSSIALSKA
jgi:hypothetical protein